MGEFSLPRRFSRTTDYAVPLFYENFVDYGNLMSPSALTGYLCGDPADIKRIKKRIGFTIRAHGSYQYGNKPFTAQLASGKKRVITRRMFKY